MMMTRRHLLAGAAVLTLLPRAAFAAAAAPETEAMLSLLPDRDAAARLGASWVQQEHKEPGAIVKSLQQRLRSSTEADAITFRHNLANAIEDDFRNGAVVKVEGWQIARTQAELCVLAYFATVGSL
jgi:hypothetical protein